MAETGSPLPPPMAARHIAVTIDRPFDEVSAFLSNPANWSSWAKGMGRLERAPDLHGLGGAWRAIQPDGSVATVVFTPPNDHGVFDHRVTLADGRIIEVPLRLLRNNRGCEIVLTLYRQPEMDDAMFERDAAMVKEDLEKLKRVR